jgi:hypothetical protein
MKKKYTIIVIGDKRRIGSFEIKAASLIMTLSVMIGLVLILFMIGTYTIKEMAAKIDSPNRQMTSATQQPENVSRVTDRPGDKDSLLPDTSSHKLTIENFQAYYDSGKKLIRYKFLLKNQSEDTAVSGHIFVILKSDVPGSGPWLVFPKTALNDGTPNNFKDGDPFSISKYKIIQNRIPTNAIYDSIMIYVFSNNGSLILKNSFNIGSS